MLPRVLRHRRPQFRILVAAVAATALTASCSTFSSADDAFSVNGTAYTSKRLSGLFTDLATGGQFTLANGRAAPQDYLGVLQALIRYESYRQWTDDLGLEETPAQRAEALASAQQSPSWATMPESIRELITNLNTADRVIASARVPADDDLRAMYERAPSSTGAVCISHILSSDRAAAEEVLERLADGADFAALAKEVSIEPAAKDTGGNLGASQQQPCQALSDAQVVFDPVFVEAAVTARPGVPTGPVQTQFGWHVILAQPLDARVLASLKNVLAEETGTRLLSGWMSTADISVDAKFGTWVGALGSIK